MTERDARFSTAVHTYMSMRKPKITTKKKAQRKMKVKKKKIKMHAAVYSIETVIKTKIKQEEKKKEVNIP